MTMHAKELEDLKLSPSTKNATADKLSNNVEVTVTELKKETII